MKNKIFLFTLICLIFLLIFKYCSYDSDAKKISVPELSTKIDTQPTRSIKKKINHELAVENRSLVLENLTLKNKKFLRKMLYKLSFIAKENDCSKIIRLDEFDNSHITCKDSFQWSEDITVNTDQTYRDDKLLSYRQYTNGLSEPVHYIRKKDGEGILQVILANVDILTLILDQNLMAKKLFFDIKTLNTALDKFQSTSYSQTVARTYEVVYAIEKILILLGTQCVDSWAKACKMKKNLDQHDFRAIIDSYIAKWLKKNNEKN